MKTASKIHWWAALLGTAALAAALAGLRLPSVPEIVRAAARPPVLTLLPAAGHEALDPSALFLPGRSGRAVARPEAAALGGQFPPIFDAADRPNLGRPPGATAVPARPAEALGFTERPDAPLPLGRADANFPPLPRRLARVEAVEAGTGRIVWALTFPLTEEVAAPTAGWQPLELWGTVGPTGLAGGGLAVRRSSGSATVDEYFQKRLARQVRVGERLAPGVYVFRVGP